MGKLTNLNPAPTDAYLPANPTLIEFGVDSINFIDFRLQPVSPATPANDFDVRILASQGIGQNGRGRLDVQADLFNVISKLSLSGGAQIARLLMANLSIDLPSISAGAVHHINVTVGGALAGDVAFFVPTVDLYNGLSHFNIQAVVISTSTIRLYFHNLYSAAVDVANFPAKLLIIGFG
jgi:hypothetical protein